MQARIRPLDDTLVLCGRARTALYMDVYDAPPGENPYELEIRAMKFPVFAGGIGPLDSKGRGRIMAIDLPVEVAGARVAPGDLVFGDADGVVVVPRAVEEEVLAAALAKVAGENATREALARGEKLADVFKRHGIL
jgi:regulator of RNase E activity RraA